MCKMLKILYFSLFFLASSFTSANTIDTVITKAESFTEKADAIDYLQSYIIQNQLEPELKIKVLKLLANLQYENFEQLQAISTLTKVKALAVDNSLEKIAAEISKTIGIYNYYKGDMPEAIKAYKFSLEYYKQVNTPIKQAHLYNNIGLAYEATDRVALSLKAYKKASQLYHLYGTEEDKIDIRFNIAGLYLNLKGFTTAIEILNEVVEVRTKLQNFHGVAQAYNHLGIAYRGIGEFELSEEYTKKSLKYFESNGHSADAMIQLNNLASLYNELSQPEKAIKFAQQAIELSYIKGHEDLRGYSFGNLAKAEYQLGNMDQAIAALAEADNIADKLNHDKIRNEHLALHTLIQASQQKLNQAVASQYQSKKIIDTLANEKFEDYLSIETEQFNRQLEQLKQKEMLKESQRNLLISIIVSGFIIVFIVYRRRVEGAYKKELEITVKKRTRELELVAKQLKRAHKIKTQFLANMSHEIRTPLTAILGQSEAIVLEEVEQSELRKEVEVIHKNSLHLLQLVNDILDLSKIESGKLDLNMEMANITDITDELQNIFSMKAKQKGLKFSIVTQLNTPYYFAVDSFRLSQILINFCSNAIKFTEKGEVKVTIFKRGECLVFSVKDSGIGMNQHQVKQVFDCFTQADSSISRRFGGTGLGLFLSLSLADLMDADIEVESNINEGSTFSFILPLIKADEDLKSQPVLNSLTTTESDSYYVGKILVVDDHCDILRVISHFLEKLGLTVLTANNANEAFNLVIKEQPEVILMDIQMPEVDGVQALTMLKDKGCIQPVYALTANAMAHEIKGYLAHGFAGHLQKPIIRADFFKMLNKHFEQVSKTDALAKPKHETDFSDLIAIFTSNLLQDKQDLESLIEQKDFVTLEHEVHKISGAAAMFGFAELSQTAMRLESAIKNKRFDEYEQQSKNFINTINAIFKDN